MLIAYIIIAVIFMIGFGKIIEDNNKRAFYREQRKRKSR
jgi:hypothetical protein